jgi:hypothetical protein
MAKNDQYRSPFFLRILQFLIDKKKCTKKLIERSIKKHFLVMSFKKKKGMHSNFQNSITKMIMGQVF